MGNHCVERSIVKKEIIRKFGLDPDAIGKRPRGWWIVEEIDSEEEQGNAEIGYLCVYTRDGASNPIDMDSLKIKNCVGTAECEGDRTYRCYYYKPLKEDNLELNRLRKEYPDALLITHVIAHTTEDNPHVRISNPSFVYCIISEEVNKIYIKHLDEENMDNKLKNDLEILCSPDAMKDENMNEYERKNYMNSQFWEIRGNRMWKPAIIVYKFLTKDEKND